MKNKTVQRYDHRVNAEEACKILLRLYPKESKVTFKAGWGTVENFPLDCFLQFIKDQAMIDEVFGDNSERTKYLIVDSDLLNFTQITNANITASLWKQERNPLRENHENITQGKGSENHVPS